MRRLEPEIIGEHDSRLFLIPENFQKWLDFFARIPNQGLHIVSDSEAEYGLRYTPGWYNLGLLELFGLITVQHGLPVPDKGWRIERIHRIALGEALLAPLYTELFGDFDKVLELEDAGKLPLGVLQPVL